MTGTPSFWHAWFSVDVTTFSLMSLAGISPDPNYYDRNFEERSRAAQAPWTPQVEDKADAVEFTINVIPHTAEVDTSTAASMMPTAHSAVAEKLPSNINTIASKSSRGEGSAESAR